MATPQLCTVLWHIRRLVAPPAVQELTDSQLVESFSTEHDQAAFAQLMKRHGPLVWGVCCHHLERHQDAEDAFQPLFWCWRSKPARSKSDRPWPVGFMVPLIEVPAISSGKRPGDDTMNGNGRRRP